jgi:xanthine dehydrogenase YagT iron-sulfur-binding subunit
MDQLECSLRVNGAEHRVLVEPRRTLLDTLRTDLQLSGAKKVCDMGTCGACTVLVDGQAMYSCLLLAVECEGQAITTVEGLANGEELDPVQRAFVEADAYQCGFCTSGQIMSMRALLNQNPSPSDDEIMRAVSGNLCRCGAYRNILEAGRIAAGRPSSTVEASDADSTR